MDRKQQQLTNLHTFTIAAKFLSFTKASEELFITQGAVSQRIKALEQQLGFNVFVRMTRRLELTPEGERLLQALTHSFDVIFSEIDNIRFNELKGELYLGVAPTFAQNWLLPRLPSFQALYPQLNIKLRVKASELNFAHEPVDLAIYYSEGHHPQFYRQRLFDEQLTPVCTPDYYQRNFSAMPEGEWLPSDATFIHCTESLERFEPNFEWQFWLQAIERSNTILSHSVTTNKPTDINVTERSYLFNHAEMAYSAAKSGIGIAMARVSQVQDSLDSGDLIAPFASVSASRGYDLICPNGYQLRAKTQAFIQWLVEQQ
jgi:LysR family D-serine deaminase transcriptional activator